MNEISLSRDADTLICVIYKDYLQRRKAGETKQRARLMGGSPEIHKNLLPQWLFEDVDDTCRELSRAKLLNCRYADNIAYIVELSDDGVIYMENRFKDGLSSVLRYIGSLIPLLPL